MNSSVALVLDRDFKGSIDELALQIPVWIISSRQNDAAVAKTRSSLQDPARVTSLFPVPGESERDTLLRALYDIDEHHGPLSGARPYSQIVVYGVAPEFLTGQIMNELGFDLLEKHTDGFTLRRHATAHDNSGAAQH